MNPEGKLKVEDILVGEHQAAQIAAGAWGLLYKVKPEYLRTLIEKLTTSSSEETIMSLPMLKLILFFAEELQRQMKANPKLVEAMEEAEFRRGMQEMMSM